MLSSKLAKLSVSLPIILSALVVTGYLITIMRIPLGFDWTDESFVIYLTNNPNTPLQQPWGFQYLLSPLLSQGQLSVVSLRYFRLLLGAVAGVLVWLSILNFYTYKNRSLTKSNIITAFAICQLGTLVQWVFWPRYLSYNEWASFFITVLVFSISNILFKNRQKNKLGFVKEVLWGFLLGVAIFGLFLARFSSVIIAVLFVMLTILTIPPLSKLVLILSSLSGFLCILLISQHYSFDLLKYIISIFEAVFSQNGMSDNGRPQNLLLFYIESVASPILVAGLVTFLGVVIYQSPNFLRFKGTTNTKKISMYLFAAATTVVIFYIYQFKNATMDADVAGSQLLVSRPGITIIFWLSSGISMIWAAYLLSSSKIENQKNERIRRRINPIPIFLVVLTLAPIAASFGTNNTLINHASFGAWSWAGLLVIGFNEITYVFEENHYKRMLFLPIITLLIASASSLQMFAYQLPYRTDAFKEMNTVVQNNNVLNGLNLTAQDSRFLSALESWKTENINASSYVIALKSPGLALLLGAKTLGSPWLDSSAPSALKQLGKDICPLQDDEEIVVIFPKNQAESELLSIRKSLMNNCDLHWPTDFVKQETNFPKFKLNGLETRIEIWISKKHMTK